jgi:hypothetical protein
LKLSKDEGVLLSDATSYRRLVGRLIYLTITRPDLAFSVQILNQFMDKPRQPHREATHSLEILEEFSSRILQLKVFFFLPSKIFTLKLFHIQIGLVVCTLKGP